MTRVHLKTLGCRLNEAELERWAEGFQAAGYALTDSVDGADLIVINSCAVTAEAVKKSRQLIRRSRRQNPQAKLVVSGCYGTLDDNLQQAIAGIDLVVANKDKDDLVKLVQERLSLETMPALATQPCAAALFARGRQRAFVKIQDGCRYRCTFCIVTVARGVERSRASADIVAEINRLHESGVREVVLTGVHVGGYGSDRGSTLHTLLRTILAESAVPRIRLGSVEPWDLDPEFLALFADRRLLPHLHLPLQSGSDSVLRRMARRCKGADFARLVARLRERDPLFNVTTDIIVGFPGETAAEWSETLAFVEQIGFGHVHVFPYSRRLGTKAATLPDQVSATEKKHRARELQSLAVEMKARYLQRLAGRTTRVLLERVTATGNGGHYHAGYSEYYTPVRFSAAEPMAVNSIVAVRLTGCVDTRMPSAMLVHSATAERSDHNAY